MSALDPLDEVTSEAGWKTSRTAGDFPVLAISFDHEIHKELKMPVGILLTSRSNKRGEAFREITVQLETTAEHSK